MANFFQTWNLPGSQCFDYIYFSAKSRREAEKIAGVRLDKKIAACVTGGHIANGLQGSLVSRTESSSWKYQGGNRILREDSGRETFYYFQCVNDSELSKIEDPNKHKFEGCNKSPEEIADALDAYTGDKFGGT